ncbi:hypothetical protein LSTR_LSTR002876 [Laodelphax striatellus]|uniref:MADF domain-containing protein n=1 Tax=Laodelphax striatellus TaxID=195883 RepID=A0A482XT03_LAOST|nr:hypothetical protein LSTR_LSTR002876 [Laodelphax striatellus]
MSASALLLSEINIERLITEVRLRPCLWDCSSDEFRDRDLKKLQWAELCQMFYPQQYENSTHKQRLELCHGLQSKWRNIKDSYRKYLKSKFGQGGKVIKSYVYATSLTFLDHVIGTPSADYSTADQFPLAVETLLFENNNCGENNTTEEEEYSEDGQSVTERRKKRRIECELENYLDLLQKARNSNAEECDDLNFFKSLLPIVKPLPIADKIKLRTEFMKIAYDYFSKSDNVKSEVITSS